MLLTFIVPVYNSQDYLKSCLDSIIPLLNQNECEIILVDDGSSDRSGSICDSYSEEYNDISVFHIKNHGAAFARNIGIQHARGTYITFVDSDDYIDALNYKIIINNADEKKYDLLFFSMNYVNEDGKRIKVPFKHTNISSDFIRYSVYMHSPCNKIFLRSIIIENKIAFNTEFKVEEDLLFVFNYMMYTNKFLILDNIGYFYRHNKKSSTHRIDPREGAENEWNAYVTLKNICVSCKKMAEFNRYLQCKKLSAAMLYITNLKIFSPKTYRKLNKEKDYWRYTPSITYKVTSLCSNYYIDVIPFLLCCLRYIKYRKGR